MLRTPDGAVIESVRIYANGPGQPPEEVPGAAIVGLMVGPESSYTLVSYETPDGETITYAGMPLRIAARKSAILDPAAGRRSPLALG